MGKSKAMTFLVSFLLALAAVCAAFAFTACTGGDKDNGSNEPTVEVPEGETGTYNAGEEGIYYWDYNEDTEYILNMQSGVYTLTSGGTLSSVAGTYEYFTESGVITFTDNSQGTTASAAFTNGFLSFTENGSTYLFQPRVEYSVTFKAFDETILTETVRNGKAATEISGERDGYLFFGWYADENFTTVFTFDGGIYADTTVYGLYVEIDDSIANYDITFVYADGKEETVRTTNGMLYDGDVPVVKGYSWWISSTNDISELTYVYGGGAFEEDTTLFAVADEDVVMGLSVYEDEIVWTYSSPEITITITDEDGTVVLSETGVYNGSYAFDFTAVTGGKYTVTLSYATESESRVYVNRGLKRISNIMIMEPRYLYFTAVENAERYIIVLEDGEGTYVIDNGNYQIFDFSGYAMGPSGLKFTVYAVAEGFYYSVSNTVTYYRGLDKATVSVSDDVISWTAVAGASYYEVYIDGVLVTTTGELSYSMVNQDAKTYSIQVRPVADGYYSELSDAYSYVKTTLRSPEITGVSEGTVYWTQVEGATKYQIYIDGTVYTIEGGTVTSFATSEAEGLGDGEIEIKVRAMANDANTNSIYSESIFVTNNEMGSALTYENGMVYWQYSLAASKYIVQVNNEDETEVTEGNSSAVTFTKYGDNVISVYFVDESGVKSRAAMITVYAYAVLLDTRGGTISSDVLYFAEGDTMVLPGADTVKLANYEFSGWYTLPDLTNFDKDASLEYSATGAAFEDGTVFDGTQMVYYAFYTPVKYTVTLSIGNGYLLDEDGEPLMAEGSDGGYASTATIELYYGRTYTLPVPVSTDASEQFYGWYSAPNHAGTQYTDVNGKSLNVWTSGANMTLYAGYFAALSFKTTKYNGQTVASVSAGNEISSLEEITIPEKCYVGGVEYSVAVITAGAFTNLSNLKIVNIPDTIQLIDTVNNGYASGTGPFSSCANIEAINIYETGDEPDTQKEITYYSEDGLLFKKDGDGVQLIYVPKGLSGTLTIPSQVSNEYEYEMRGVTEVKVYRDVTSIAQQVFASNTKITSVTIPSSITSIESQAFYSATKLESVIFEEVAGAANLSISSNAFQKCTALTSVTLPSHLTSFDPSMFDGCTSLTEINMSRDGDVYTSRSGLLCDATGTTIVYAPKGIETLNITDTSITKIGNSAFTSCTKLASVTIPGWVTEIGVEAFYKCTALTELTFGGDANSNPLTIKADAFYGCTKLTEITLPANLATLEKGAFGGCSKLVTVTVMSRGTLNFADEAFANTSGTYYVKTVNLSNYAGLLSVSGVFGPNVTSVTLGLEGETATESQYYAMVDGVLYNKEVTEIYYFPYGKTEYSTPDTLEEITTYTFRNRTDLTTVTIGTSVVEVGEGAFYGCSALTTVTFTAWTDTEVAASDLVIGPYAFYKCTALANITLPERTLEIGNYAFYGCKALTSFTIPENTRYIGEYDSNGKLVEIHNVFYNCSSLSEITVAEGNQYFKSEGGLVTTMDGTEIYFCSSGYAGENGTVTISEGIKKIWDYAFNGNEAMTKLVFDENMDFEDFSMGTYAFANCEALAEVVLPEGMLELNQGLFSGCTALTKVTIPTTVTHMEIDVFYGDENLAEIEFTQRVTDEKGNYTELVLDDGTGNSHSVFSGLSSLKSITLPEGTTRIPTYAFKYCYALAEINIPSTVTEIGDYSINFYDSSLYSGGSYDYEKLTKIKVTVAGTAEAPSKLESIGTSAFFGTWLDKLDLSYTSLKSLGQYAFEYCACEEIKFPDTLSTLAKQSMYACYIDTIEIPGAETLEDSVFELSGATSISLGSVKSLGSKVFYQNASLTTLTFGASSAGLTVGTYCFAECSLLTKVELPEGTTSLGNYAFDADEALEDVYLPVSLESIGTYVFRSCTALKEIKFGTTGYEDTSLSSIGNYAFTKSGVEKVIFPKYVDSNGSVRTISLGTNLFNGCTDIEEIYLSASISEITNMLTSNTSAIETITVDPESQNFSVIEGCPILFDKTYTAIYWVFMSGENQMTELDLTNITYTATGEGDGSVTETAKIKEIGSYAFQYCDALTKLTIPSDVTSIGTYAFQYCTSLTEVTFSGTEGSITKMPSYAFYHCEALEKITLPGSVNEFDTYAFEYCYALKTISLDNIMTYGNYCLAYTGLETVTIAEGVTSLGTSGTATSHVFYHCKSLSSVTLPSTLTLLGRCVFAGCTSLTSIDLTYIKTIGGGGSSYGAFYQSGLTTLFIPSTVETINTYAFNSCENLTTVTFCDGCTFMGEYMFYQCTSLTTVTLPENEAFDTIAASGFRSCSSLTSISLPSNITALGNYCLAYTGLTSVDLTYITTFGTYLFYSCHDLTEVTWPSSSTEGSYDITDEISGASDMFFGCSFEEIDLPDTLTAVPTYFFQNNTNLKKVTLPEGVTAVPNQMCYGCTALEEITFEGKMTSFGQNAFYNCKSLKSIDTTYLTVLDGYQIFYGCESLTEIDISGVDSLSSASNSKSMFQGCTNLETVVLSDNLTLLSNSMFYGCESLVNLNIPSALTSLGSTVFYDCGITEAVLPSGVTSVPTKTFQYCSDLETVEFQGDVTSITANLFEGCTSLKSFRIPDGVTSIASSAFLDCESLESIIIPDGVTSITANCFENCCSLVFVSIPGGVTSIAASAFAGCVLLGSDEEGTITIPEAVTSIAAKAFYNTGLTEISLSSGLKTLGNQAFGACQSLVEISVNSDNPYFYSQDNVIFSATDDSLLLYPAGITADEDTETFVGTLTADGTLTLGEDIEKIGAYAFDGCNKLSAVWIHDAVTYVDEAAFNGCEADVFIENTVDYVEEMWSSKWLDGFAGSAYYALGDVAVEDLELEFNDEGTAYRYSYWYMDGEELKTISYAPDVYTTEGASYILYNAELDRIVKVYLSDEATGGVTAYSVDSYYFDETAEEYIITLVDYDYDVAVTMNETDKTATIEIITPTMYTAEGVGYVMVIEKWSEPVSVGLYDEEEDITTEYEVMEYTYDEEAETYTVALSGYSYEVTVKLDKDSRTAEINVVIPEEDED